MDATVPITILTFGGVLKAPAEDVLKRVGGPAADELGGWIRDSIREFRTRNIERTLARAEEMLGRAGIVAHPVPLRTLLPLLAGASLEDDAKLGELWAALLAHAAYNEQPSVPPIFPITLGQLTPFDARLLVELKAIENGGLPEDPVTTAGKPPVRWGARRAEIAEVLSITQGEQLEVALNTLLTLGLVENEPVVRTMREQPQHMYLSNATEFRLSALGRTFIRACTAPNRVGEAPSE